MTHTEHQHLRYLNTKVVMDLFKGSEPCADCGGVFPPECMDFDHVRGTKLFSIGWRMAGSHLTLQREIEKCDLVCANCHRIRGVTRRDGRAK